MTEPSADNVTGLEWVKSTHSTAEGPNCIEVAASPGTVHVRDSKNPQGPQLAFSPAEWSAFITYASTHA